MHKPDEIKKPLPKGKKAPGHVFLSEQLLRRLTAEKGIKIADPGEPPVINVKILPRIP